MFKIIKTFYEFLNNSKKPIVLCFGGAGSGKSYAICQHIIRKLYEEKNKRFLVLRKTLPSLRITCYQLILDLLEEYKLPYKLNKASLTIQVNDNILWFRSLDQPEKIKSLNINYAFLEEATELSFKDFLQIQLRMRRPTGGQNQIFLALNPISKLSWVYEELIAKSRDDIDIHKSTYKNNPFLAEQYIKELKRLKDQDYTYYQIYVLSEWGILQNIIYSNYDLIENLPNGFDEIIYGLDFGYNNPSALVEVGVKDKEIYEKELLYQTHLTNEDLIGQLIRLIPNKNNFIYADTAEPARIEEIRRAGFNIHRANKSVKNGIDFIKRQKDHIFKGSVNLVKEIEGYKYKEDKDGNVLEEPLKFRDHLMDARRYAIFTHLKKYGEEEEAYTASGLGIF